MINFGKDLWWPLETGAEAGVYKCLPFTVRTYMYHRESTECQSREVPALHSFVGCVEIHFPFFLCSKVFVNSRNTLPLPNPLTVEVEADKRQ